MQIDVITLFPKMFEGVFAEGMIKRAIDKEILKLNLHDMRKWAWNSYGAVDDKPYGGGVGMLIRADVIFNALKEISNLEFQISKPKNNSGQAGRTRTILLSARGKRYTQKKAEELAKLENITLICGRYEGVDQRVADYMVDEEISIGDYVLTGGELGAMVIIDTTVRLIKGVLGKDESSKDESFSEKTIRGRKKRIIEYPQYTRPAEFMGHKVPEILLSGDPKKINEWQLEQSGGDNDNR